MDRAEEVKYGLASASAVRGFDIRIESTLVAYCC